MPANNSEVIVYIAVDNAKGITQYGGTVAAPIAKNVLKSFSDCNSLAGIFLSVLRIRHTNPEPMTC